MPALPFEQIKPNRYGSDGLRAPPPNALHLSGIVSCFALGGAA